MNLENMFVHVLIVCEYSHTGYKHIKLLDKKLVFLDFNSLLVMEAKRALTLFKESIEETTLIVKIYFLNMKRKLIIY